MNVIIFQNRYKCLNFVFTVFENTVFEKKNQGFNRKNVSTITRKILECNMKSCYKNISKIRNVFILQNFEKKKIKNVIKKGKIPMDSVKSMNLF